MKIITFFLLAFMLIACSDEKKTNPSEEPKEEVLIEQDDEKTEVNDTNVPLPVSEPSTHLQSQIYALTLFQIVVGGGGVKKNDSLL